MNREPARELPPDALAQVLGWFSIALGAAEVVAPAAMSRLIGIREDDQTTTLVRAMGAREIGHGIAILTGPGSAGPVWSRVAGDAVDLAFLGSRYSADYVDQRRLMMAGAAVLGVTALDVITARRLGDGSSAGYMPEERAESTVTKAVTINKPIEQVFAFWQQLENLPRFMRYLESVERLDGGRSRWRAKGPGGVPVQWEAETLSERENEIISWRSVPGSTIQTSGTVRFERAPGARGTEVHVEMQFQPPAGPLGKTVAWITGRDPSRQLHEDLMRFKQLLETGEIALSEGMGLWRPGRPARRPEKIRTLAGVEA
jgi:uncharacterized membrane protein